MLAKHHIFVKAGQMLLVLSATLVSAQAMAAWYVNDTEARKSLAKIDGHIQYIRNYYENHGQNTTPVIRQFSDYSWPVGQQLPKVDEDFGLQVSCGTEPSVTAATIRSRLQQGFSVAADADHDDVKAAQVEICGAMRVLTNIRYNESVELVTQTLPAIRQRYEQSVLADIDKNRPSNGAARGFNNSGAHQVSLLAAQLEFDMAITTYRERQSQYEQYVGLLGSYNDYLGRRVLAGNGAGGGEDVSGGSIFNRLLNSLVGGSVVQAALKLGN